MDIAIVVPAYNEEGNVRPLYEAVAREMAQLSISWSMLFVDDGSRDGTWAEIEALAKADRRVEGIRLSRNFGHQNALVAGLAHSKADAVISMDSDLQHPPHVIPKLIKEWQSGFDIVRTIRRSSADSPYLKTLTSKWYYTIFTYLSGVEIRAGASDFRLIDRKVLKEILNFNEHELFLRGIVEWVGYPSSSVEYSVESRHSGESKYTVLRMLKFAWNGITSFSLVPLRVGVLIGLATSFVAFTVTVYAILAKYLSGQVVPGWASSLALTSFLFGVLFVLLGVLGEYLGRVLIEVRSRPRYLIGQSTNETRRATVISHTDTQRATAISHPDTNAVRDVKASAEVVEND